MKNEIISYSNIKNEVMHTVDGNTKVFKSKKHAGNLRDLLNNFGFKDVDYYPRNSSFQIENLTIECVSLRTAHSKYIDSSYEMPLGVLFGSQLIIFPNSLLATKAWRTSVWNRIMNHRPSFRERFERDHLLLRRLDRIHIVKALECAEWFPLYERGNGIVLNFSDQILISTTLEIPSLHNGVAQIAKLNSVGDLFGDWFAPIKSVGEVKCGVPGFHIYSTLKSGNHDVCGGGCSRFPEYAKKKAIYEWIERVCHKLEGLSDSESSNGTAAHEKIQEAIQNAILELVERDAIIRCFDEENFGLLDSSNWINNNLIQSGFDALIAQAENSKYLPIVFVFLFNKQLGKGAIGTAAKMTLADAIESSLSEAVTNYTRRLVRGNLISVDQFIELTSSCFKKPVSQIDLDWRKVIELYEPTIQEITHTDLKQLSIHVVKARSSRAISSTTWKSDSWCPKRPDFIEQLLNLQIWS